MRQSFLGFAPGHWTSEIRCRVVRCHDHAQAEGFIGSVFARFHSFPDSSTESTIMFHDIPTVYTRSLLIGRIINVRRAFLYLSEDFESERSMRHAFIIFMDVEDSQRFEEAFDVNRSSWICARLLFFHFRGLSVVRDRGVDGWISTNNSPRRRPHLSGSFKLTGTNPKTGSLLLRDSGTSRHLEPRQAQGHWNFETWNPQALTLPQESSQDSQCDNPTQR